MTIQKRLLCDGSRRGLFIFVIFYYNILLTNKIYVLKYI